MAKRTRATSWELVGGKDETGAMVNIDYKCPYCGYDTGNLIFVGSSNVDKIDEPWETDQVCPVCDKDVIVECR